jgi:hypothetical protein
MICAEEHPVCPNSVSESTIDKSLICAEILRPVLAHFITITSPLPARGFPGLLKALNNFRDTFGA